jgi:hypothetical protein
MDMYGLLCIRCRRHSQEIALDNHVAVAIAVKTDQPVIGLQAEGSVELVNDSAIIKQVMQDYTKKHNTGHEYYDRFIAGENQHRVYKFTPDSYTLFDEVHFPGGAGQQVRV